ncbi:MAG: DMT family transporter [Nitrososphaerota archaeon]|nr:DMT family transporter [Nitrososphaerota archaeon]MDG6966204.1 DMT family transporter [Nitrososphaerota archaeon]MDG6977639.1 DMT family transporter [Nitrososphaerota archaeon]MDG7005516.1 DMT family transporter [Nitrososphaerota archaeon]MDG7020380.1 DMT family transporter [Nitrososphaerota archaeon]
MVAAAIVLGLALAFCFGTSDYLSKGLVGKVGSYRATVYTLATSGALVAVPSLFLGEARRTTYADGAILGVIACSTFAAFAFMYRGYQRGNLSVVSPVVNSFPIFSVGFSVLVLGVRISGGVLLALTGVILGVLLVSTDMSVLGSARRTLTPGVPEALAASVLFAVALTSLGDGYSRMGYLLPPISARAGGALVGLLAGAASGQDLRPFRGPPLVRLLAMAALEAAGLFAFGLASFYSSGLAALPITTTLAGMGAVFTVGFALLLLKERVMLNHAVGIAVIVTSVAALLYLTA